ncbi:hypothetical protein E2C01_020158 [Portunus trituberculatus]|uniref:Uncharacterized protein n=1 Tax=Portunus trituberculatus TaxID=210409 RepID=A0A5B7E1D0_PORTR|nr:hypothetical protein [Portunus trituberculatus]
MGARRLPKIYRNGFRGSWGLQVRSAREAWGGTGRDGAGQGRAGQGRAEWDEMRREAALNIPRSLMFKV